MFQFFVFFFKQKTAYEMRISDWSSDVCSSDLLKLLLDRMSVHRDEVAQWRWGGGHDARAARSRNISNAMLPARLTTKWRDLETGDRNLAGVRAIEVATPADRKSTRLNSSH